MSRRKRTHPLLLVAACLYIWALPTLAEVLDSPPTGRWLSSSFTGPEDGQLWHSVFYVAAVERPQLITRHSGLMIRCTAAPISRNLKVAFAFGAVLRTNREGAVNVEIALDGRAAKQLQLITRNQANAEFFDQGAKRFLLRLLTANTLQFSARLSPNGSSSVAMPLAPGRAEVTQMLDSCGIDLASDVRVAAARNNKKPSLAETAESDPVVLRSPLARAVSGYLAANNAEELGLGSRAIAALQPSVSAVIAAFQAPDALVVPSSSLPGRGEEGLSSREVGGLALPFHVSVPARQPPAQGMPLAVVLHGGVQRPAWRERERWWQDYPFGHLLRNFLVVSPAGWRDAHWWGTAQEQNLSELIAQMKRHYRVDESRVFVIGVSDGAAGAMNLAMRDATPLAGVVSLIGHPGVLFENRINPDAHPQFANLSQVPLFMANGGADPGMPQNTIAPWLQSMRALGVRVAAHLEEGMGHSLDFGADVYAELGRFLLQNRRERHPVELAWEAGTAQLPARNRWLVIESLRPDAETGCVQARRLRDGSYRLQTQGVAQLRVLIDHGSEEALRLMINANAANSQTERLEASPSVATLLRWHARDASRTEFFSTEHLLDIAADTQGLCQSPIAHSIVADAGREELQLTRKRRAEELRAANSGGLDRPSGAPSGGGLPVDGGSSDSGSPQGDPTRIRRPGERR